MPLHERLKAARKQAGFTSAQRAAACCAIAPSVLYAYESGESAPGSDALRSLCTLYRVSPVWLLGLGAISFRRMR